MKDVAYAHLDISICNFEQHSLKQWELIHGELAQLFFNDPLLKIGGGAFEPSKTKVEEGVENLGGGEGGGWQGSRIALWMHGPN